MKWIFFFIVFLHALIHLLGFVKAFQIAEINQLTQQISKPIGVLWLLAFLFLAAAAIQFIFDKDIWWIAAAVGIILSQILIILYWQDAKFGTIPNIVIFLAALAAFANWNFNNNVKNEISDMLSKADIAQNEILTEEKIADLPLIIQKWLINSGAVGKEMIYSVFLKQKGEMRMKPEQNDWYKSKAEQNFITDKPAFIWKVKVEMMPLVFFTGRDKFLDGKGSMIIKILSLINIVNILDNDKLNQGTLQRYLGEISWFPTAAVSPFIKWEEVDSLIAKATMTYKGTSGSALFEFDDKGELIKFSAMRFKEITDNNPTEWIINLTDHKFFNGIKIPTKGEAIWKLADGDFTWYKLEIYDVEYNNKSIGE